MEAWRNKDVTKVAKLSAPDSVYVIIAHGEEEAMKVRLADFLEQMKGGICILSGFPNALG